MFIKNKSKTEIALSYCITLFIIFLNLNIFFHKLFLGVIAFFFATISFVLLIYTWWTLKLKK